MCTNTFMCFCELNGDDDDDDDDDHSLPALCDWLAIVSPAAEDLFIVRAAPTDFTGPSKRAMIQDVSSQGSKATTQVVRPPITHYKLYVATA